MVATKRLKKGESELQRDGDREDLAPGAEVTAQGDEADRASEFGPPARRKFLKVTKSQVNSERS